MNRVLPHSQLSAATVPATAELIRLAITGRRKRIDYVSTLGINTVAAHLVDEDEDRHTTIGSCALGGGYANGYSVRR